MSVPEGRFPGFPDNDVSALPVTSGTASSAAGSPDTSEQSARSWCVYLLSCADDTLYCGVTTDISRRLAMHNGSISGGAKYTRGRRPVTLAALADGLTRSEALRLEARIKRTPKMQKLAVLEAGAATMSGSRMARDDSAIEAVTAVAD